MIDFRMMRAVTLTALGCAALTTALAANAADPAPATWTAPPAAPSAPSSSVPGWNAFLDGLRDLPDRVLARLPVEQRNDPQIRQEVGRLALSAVAAGSIEALTIDPNHPVFVPAINNYLTIGQPNADTNYRGAKITPGGTYRLRGHRGSMNQVRIAETGPRPQQTPGSVNLGGLRPVHDLNTLKTDAQGRYDVILSAVRPAGYTGDWWPLDSSSDGLMVRMVGSDWANEVEPTLSIERLDGPATRTRPSAAVLERNLRAIPAYADFIAPLLVSRSAQLRAEGTLNKLRAVDFSKQGGLTGQFYFEGAYDLKDDEALIIETPVPQKCTYHSLILTNDIYETTDWYNNHSSLNGSQAPIDKDGILRVVISAKDPGVPNWLDTAGYPTGVVQGRWMECSSQPVPSVRKVALSAVRQLLPRETPTITPQEREQRIRDRRAALQQRPLW